MQQKKGLEFILPEGVEGKAVSVIEVGPHHEQGLADEINKRLGTSIDLMTRIDSYILVHDPDLKERMKELLEGPPFVDRIIHRATLDESLAQQLAIPYDYVLQSMLNPGTSDAWGNVALQQALLALGTKPKDGDYGFYSPQYYLVLNSPKDTTLEDISAFLANPDLNKRLIIPRLEYDSGKKIFAPIVTLPPETRVETFDLVNLSDDELLALSKKRKLAASLEEMQQFRDVYKDAKFIEQRQQNGLDEKATDVELETWFGLRSEHCFHKEFNAHITIEDKANDFEFARAFNQGIITKDDAGRYLIGDGLFKTFVAKPAQAVYDKLQLRGNNWIVSMFKDNSGVVSYDEDYMFCIKFETHNSPSNKEPVQGAKTGIDGVNRDIFGTLLGTFDAIANFFLYCTGHPDYKGWLPKGVKHPYTLLKGATQGVREGGNESQIATLGGGLVTDPRYIAKCLVHCGTVGWSPTKSLDGRSYIEKHAQIGDIVYVAGQPVGVDGVHGATESSLKASADISLGHVQADFSFIQAKVKEFYQKAARSLLFSDTSDCGAMGLGSATHELATSTGGLEMDLALHPVKYNGIQPWQVNCSETQDRMVFTARPENVPEIERLAKMHEVDATPLGKLTSTGFVKLNYKNKTVALIDIQKLFNKEPRKRMKGAWNGPAMETNPVIKDIYSYSFEQSLCMVMEQPDVASKEWFFRQKDSSVKGATIQGPLIGRKQEVEADATIQKPLDTEGKDYGAIAYSFGIAPKLSDIDPYHSAQRSFIDMVGKIIAVGGALPDMKSPNWDAWAVCGNYCQPDSDSATVSKENAEHNLASLVREGMGVRDAIEATNIPVISGKDSMKCSCTYDADENFNLADVPPDLRKHITIYNDEKTGKKKIEIHDPDSYLASCAVKIEDYRTCVNSAFKEHGDLIYIVGTTRSGLGASQYMNTVGYKEWGMPLEGGKTPKADLEEFVRVANAVHRAIKNELVASCSYIHNGGIAAAVAKGAMAGDKGAVIDLNSGLPDQLSEEEFLYSETPGRFVVTVSAGRVSDANWFERTLGNVPYFEIGTVAEEQLIMLKKEDGTTKAASLQIVKASYQKPLRFGLDACKRQE